ncbi:photosystem II stability/assembly factor-like protein [Algoriphagus aestuarii]|nr:photosystem II stability/assembly factor-like protein [Algoriphagus aestuarii]
MRKLVGVLVIGILFSCQTNEIKIPESPLGWEIFETPVKASLRGLSPVTSEIAWASGSGGTWLRTMDGGKSWDHGIIGGLDTVDFRSIHAFDAMNAVAISAGQPAVIYKTKDGGQSWTLKHQEVEEAFLDGVSFADPDRGYVVGDPIDGKWMILQTVNQGESWYPVLNLPEAKEGEAGFAASATSLISEGSNIWIGSGGTEANLHYSPDYGENWKKWNSPIVQGDPSKGVFSLTKLGNEEVYLVGGDYVNMDDTISVAASFSTLKEFWAAPVSSPKGYRSGVVYFPRFHWLVAVGPTGSDFSDDGGQVWRNFSQEGFHAVKLGHAEATIWASGSNGRVARLKVE